jgi:hypothetical protein
MIDKRSRLVGIIEVLFEQKYASETDIKATSTYEELIYDKPDYANSDAFRMLVNRDIAELKKLKIIENANGANASSYKLTEHFDKIREEYAENKSKLYEPDITDEEIDEAYMDAKEIAESIFDVFSISQERRQIIKKSLGLESFSDSISMAFKIDNNSQVAVEDIQKFAIEIMLEDYILPQNHLLPWSDEDKRDVIRKISQGKCIDEVAKHFKRTRRAIIYKLPEYQILTDLIRSSTFDTIEDLEARGRLTRLNLLEFGENEEYQLSSNLQNIIEWSRNTNNAPGNIAAVVLYDGYFVNCRDRQLIPLSHLHIMMSRAGLVHEVPADQDDYFETIYRDNIPREELEDDFEDEVEEYSINELDDLYFRIKKEKLNEKLNEIDTQDPFNIEE